ncbi:MAG: efflux RND transporter periplasmic adaptor subunit [Myxococcota bacterium]
MGSTVETGETTQAASEVLAVISGRKKGRWLRRGIWLVVLGALVAGGLALRNRMVAAESAPPEWRTAAVARGDLAVVVDATGRLEALSTVDVGAEVSGRVIAVEAEYNDRVTKGQVLARIDTVSLKAQLEQGMAALEASKASLRQAQATRTEAKQTRARVEALAKKGVASTEQVEAARAAYARASATVAAGNADIKLAEARVETTRTDLEKAVIYSPIDGVVLEQLVREGATVAASFQAPVLFQLAEDLAHMRVSAAVDEADVGRVAPGQKATFTVDAFPLRTFDASVAQVRLAPTITGEVVTYTTLLDVPNEGGELRPGMTATATITTELRAGVLRVPNAALRFDPAAVDEGAPAVRMPFGGGPAKKKVAEKVGGEAGVWVLRAGEPTWLAVTKGATDGRFTEVSGEGVTEGLEVLTGVVRRATP